VHLQQTVYRVPARAPSSLVVSVNCELTMEVTIMSLLKSLIYSFKLNRMSARELERELYTALDMLQPPVELNPNEKMEVKK